MALAREGVHLVIAARRREVLEGAADEIAAAAGNRPKTVIADVTTAEGRDALLAACPAPDILINNAGGPPPGDFRKFERDEWIKALDGNMLAPIALIKATLDGMIERKFGRIVNVTSHAVEAGAGRDARAFRRCPFRLDRLCRRSRAIHRRSQCDHQQSPAWHL